MLRTVFVAAAILLQSAAASLGEDRLRASYREGFETQSPRAAAIAMRERVAIREFFARHYAEGRCAPGLSKFHNSCLPPSAARRFTIGKPLAASVPASPIPLDLAERIAAPAGHRYLYLDGHIILVAANSRLVVDAMSVSMAMQLIKPQLEGSWVESATAE